MTAYLTGSLPAFSPNFNKPQTGSSFIFSFLQSKPSTFPDPLIGLCGVQKAKLIQESILWLLNPCNGSIK
uniref:Uncharacterized protein n=1 Tax=Salix viminalis TaxID=40686 RepID=A0A6N2KKH3_SALVM